MGSPADDSQLPEHLIEYLLGIGERGRQKLFAAVDEERKKKDRKPKRVDEERKESDVDEMPESGDPGKVSDDVDTDKAPEQPKLERDPKIPIATRFHLFEDGPSEELLALCRSRKDLGSLGRRPKGEVETLQEMHARLDGYVDQAMDFPPWKWVPVLADKKGAVRSQGSPAQSASPIDEADPCAAQTSSLIEGLSQVLEAHTVASVDVEAAFEPESSAPVPVPEEASLAAADPEPEVVLPAESSALVVEEQVLACAQDLEPQPDPESIPTVSTVLPDAPTREAVVAPRAEHALTPQKPGRKVRRAPYTSAELADRALPILRAHITGRGYVSGPVRLVQGLLHAVNHPRPDYDTAEAVLTLLIVQGCLVAEEHRANGLPNWTRLKLSETTR